VVQCAAISCSLLQLCSSALQFAATCCSVLQYVCECVRGKTQIDALETQIDALETQIDALETQIDALAFTHALWRGLVWRGYG